jgi:hypothetical protein
MHNKKKAIDETNRFQKDGNVYMITKLLTSHRWLSTERLRSKTTRLCCADVRLHGAGIPQRPSIGAWGWCFFQRAIPSAACQG